MFNQFDEAVKFIVDRKIQMVDLKFCDLWGRWHHITISGKQFTPDLLRSGVGFDGSSVGFKSVHAGDMVLVPDVSTGFLDPFWDEPTLSFICNTLEADTKLGFPYEPREIVRHAEAYMKSLGIADESLWGPEYEFYIFDQVYFENSINTASYHIDSMESMWTSPQGGHGHYNALHGGYHSIPPKDHYFNLRNRMSILLQEIGIPVKYHHHEVGGPGQCEIETPMMGMLPAADASMVIKYITKMVARQECMTVSFLPKPLYGEAGNGMHFHMQLFKDGKNVFYDVNGPSLMSQTALYYIGGLLSHAPAVLALTNPSTNSYRRLVPGFEAPVNAFFSLGNRSAAIRIPRYATEPDEVRFEFRPPDATCNPYLATAAMLMAGLDGIKNKIDPTANGFGPINEDIFSWTDEQRATIKSLPTSLQEALNALENDYDFLLAGDVFDRQLIKNWIKNKRKEDYEVKVRPHPFEIQQYFDF